MFFTRFNFLHTLRRTLVVMLAVILCTIPETAFASWEIVDGLDLSPFIPRVLDAFMMVARGGYEYFVGKGDGVIYILVWGFLAVSVFLYIFKMYFPKRWIEFFGMSGGGEMWEGKLSAWGMSETVLKNAMRAIVAAVVLLQVKPVYITQWLINPFLEFGAIYTKALTDAAPVAGVTKQNVECPAGVLSGKWLNETSCKFLVQPVADLSSVNNTIIKRGFQTLSRGLRGLITIMPHGGSSIMDIVTGILLITTFVGCNFFMALLVIQGIFDFGMSLILYPFQVLAWVAKPNDKWFDVLPAFNGIIKALQKLVITMIACAFILIINVAIVRALFQWNTPMFVAAAGGAASGNITSEILRTNTVGFGGHSLLWLSSILTFFLMRAIFDLTRKQLEIYAPGMSGMYNQVKSDAKATFDWSKNAYKSLKTTLGLIKK